MAFGAHVGRHLQQLALDAIPLAINGLELLERHQTSPHDDSPSLNNFDPDKCTDITPIIRQVVPKSEIRSVRLHRDSSSRLITVTAIVSSEVESATGFISQLVASSLQITGRKAETRYIYRENGSIVPVTVFESIYVWGTDESTGRLGPWSVSAFVVSDPLPVDIILSRNFTIEVTSRGTTVGWR